MKVTDVRFVAGATSMDRVPKDRRAQVALVGPSNVGKSSLLNSLVGRKGLARVSRTPGRTQQLNFFLVNEKFYLVDLPGYGFAEAPRAVHEQFLRLVEHYLAECSELRLLVLLLDCRRDPSERDVDLLKWLRANGVPHAIVLTKADKLSRSQLVQREKAVTAGLVAAHGWSPELLPVSSVTGLGRKELWALVARAAASAPKGDSRGRDSLREPEDVS